MSKSLKDYQNEYFEASVKASEINRTLALAGVAIVWTLSIGDSSKAIAFPKILSCALFSIVLSLIFDLTQYIFRTISIAIFYSRKEGEIDKLTIEEQSSAKSDVTGYPFLLRWIGWILFGAKILFMVIGYVYILKHLNFLK